MEVLAGTGGWDYFPTSQEDKLMAYSREFRFVEVNSTFYHLPSLSVVRSWRRRAGEDFVFSVKCNGLATHVQRLKPIEATFRVLDTMFSICRLFHSDKLVLQTPHDLRVDGNKIKEVSTTLKNVETGRVKSYWEARSTPLEQKPRKLWSKMLDEGIYSVVDLSKIDPPENSKIIYSRLFSGGSPEYGEKTLRDIRRRVEGSGAERVVLAFHGINMYRDASRFLKSMGPKKANYNLPY